MIVEINNFFTDSFCDEIIERCSALIDKNKLGIEYNREGNTVSFQDHENLKDLDKKIFDLINLFISHRLIYMFSLGHVAKIKDQGYSFHRYEKGDKVFTHGDGVYINDRDVFHPRLLSLVVNLTTNENADLIFPRHNKIVKSEKGKLVAFLPHYCYEHYMNNNSGKNRDVLVTWLLDETIECRKINNVTNDTNKR